MTIPDSRPEIRDMHPYEPGKPLDEIAREYDFEGTPVKLTSNENPFSPPEFLREVYEEEFERLNRYPDGGQYHLRTALSDYYDWPRDGIVIGAGSDEVTDFLSKAYLEADDEVLVADPSFVRHSMLPKIMGARPVKIPVDDSFNIALERILENINEKTAWICLPNPNNPTSRYVDEKQLRSFLDEVPARITVILDEAYYEFMDAEDYPDGREIIGDYTDQDSPTLILQRTFSKAYSLAGLRVGYALMKPEIADEIHKVRPPFNVSRPAQAVAQSALSATKFLDESLRTIRNERDRVLDELAGMNLEVVPPSANFFLLKTPGRMDSEEFCEKLMEKGVIVRSMNPYGLSNYVRVSVGTAEENNRFLEALGEVIE